MRTSAPALRTQPMIEVIRQPKWSHNDPASGLTRNTAEVQMEFTQAVWIKERWLWVQWMCIPSLQWRPQAAHAVLAARVQPLPVQTITRNRKLTRRTWIQQEIVMRAFQVWWIFEFECVALLFCVAFVALDLHGTVLPQTMSHDQHVITWKTYTLPACLTCIRP